MKGNLLFLWHVWLATATEWLNIQLPPPHLVDNTDLGKILSVQLQVQTCMQIGNEHTEY